MRNFVPSHFVPSQKATFNSFKSTENTTKDPPKFHRNTIRNLQSPHLNWLSCLNFPETNFLMQAEEVPRFHGNLARADLSMQWWFIDDPMIHDESLMSHPSWGSSALSISNVPLYPCLHKVPSHRDTNICAMPSDSTRGKSTPPKFASRKMLVKDASVRQAQGCVEWASFESFHVLFGHTALQVFRFFRGSGNRSINMPRSPSSTRTSRLPHSSERVWFDKNPNIPYATSFMIYKGSRVRDMDRYRKLERWRLEDSILPPKEHREMQRNWFAFLVNTRKCTFLAHSWHDLVAF